MDEKKNVVQYQQTLWMEIHKLSPCLGGEEGDEYVMTNFDDLVLSFLDSIIEEGYQPVSTLYFCGDGKIMCVVQYISQSVINQMRLARGGVIEIPVPKN